MWRVYHKLGISPHRFVPSPQGQLAADVTMSPIKTPVQRNLSKELSSVSLRVMKGKEVYYYPNINTMPCIMAIIYITIVVF